MARWPNWSRRTDQHFKSVYSPAMTKMLYACDNCHYLFPTTVEKTCPDCGKPTIRPATDEEQEDYKNRRNENLWTDDNGSC